jgi:hypothetical protein
MLMVPTGTSVKVSLSHPVRFCSAVLAGQGDARQGFGLPAKRPTLPSQPVLAQLAAALDTLVYPLLYWAPNS